MGRAKVVEGRDAGYQNMNALVLGGNIGNISHALSRQLENARSLVLNADYRPISVMPPSILTWQEAFKAVWTGALDVLEVYEGLSISSPSTKLHIPSVLKSNQYVKSKRRVHFSRHNLLMRDHYRCQYCGKPGTGVELVESKVVIDRKFSLKRAGCDLTYDHVIPRSKNGKTTWNNIVMACSKCNSEKQDRHDYKSPMKPPRQPTYDEIANFAKRQPMTIPCPKWGTYLDWVGPLHVQTPLGEEYALIKKDGIYERGIDEEGDDVGF